MSKINKYIKIELKSLDSVKDGWQLQLPIFYVLFNQRLHTATNKVKVKTGKERTEMITKYRTVGLGTTLQYQRGTSKKILFLY